MAPHSLDAGGASPAQAEMSTSATTTSTVESPPASDSTADGTGETAATTPSTIAAFFHRQVSLSETAQLSAGGWDAPGWLSWFEVPFRLKDPVGGQYVGEATGWAMDSAARGPLIMIGSYMGSAILRLASDAAGCPSPRNCNNTVAAGLKPSSLLTLVSTVAGVVAAILMPIFGAIVDHTRHRKLVGIVSAVVAVLVTGMQIGISYDPNNWLYILILDGIQTFAVLVHATAVFAYLPDITLNHKVLPKYNGHFYIRQFLSQVSVGVVVILISWKRGDTQSIESSVLTARDGAAVAFSYACVLFGYGWTFLFRKRPALSHVPEGSNLVTTGFRQVYNTSRKIGSKYRALRWFMFSLLWSPEAGAGTVMSIAVTYFTTVMRFTTFDIAQVALVVMSLNVVGSRVSTFVCNRIMNPLNSYRAALTLFAVSFAAGAAYMDDPEQRAAVFGFAATLGFFMGWAYPSQRVLFVTLIPKGQETEMMGLFFFVGQILGWLPTLIFTIMNERGVNMKWGISIIAFFSFFSVLCTFFMGSYQEATELVARDSADKLKLVLDAASDQRNYSGHRNQTESGHKQRESDTNNDDASIDVEQIAVTEKNGAGQ